MNAHGEDLREAFSRVRRANAEAIVEFIAGFSEYALGNKLVFTVDEVRDIFRQIIESTRRIGGV